VLLCGFQPLPVNQMMYPWGYRCSWGVLARPGMRALNGSVRHRASSRAS
jgi:hypothetical protein